MSRRYDISVGGVSVQAVLRLCTLLSAAFFIQGCTARGFYYHPSIADSGHGIARVAKNDGCRFPISSPDILSLSYPGLTISAAASAYNKNGDAPVSMDKANFVADLMVRLVVKEGHVIVTDLSEFELHDLESGIPSPMDSKRYYIAEAHAGRIEHGNFITEHSRKTYTEGLMQIKPGPSAFQLIIPSLLLDGNQLGPIEMLFTRDSGIWASNLFC